MGEEEIMTAGAKGDAGGDAGGVFGDDDLPLRGSRALLTTTLLLIRARNTY